MTAQTPEISAGADVPGSLLTALAPPGLFPSLAGNWRWTEGGIFSLWTDAIVLFN